MADTSIFVRNGLHSPIIAEVHEAPEKDEEMSSAWKILKIILFVVCLIVFVQQTVTLFKLYYSYPTETRTAVTRPAHFKVPAVTFCSDNPIKRSEFCLNEPLLCEEVIQMESCKNFDSEIPDFGDCTEDRKGNTSEEVKKRLCSRENFKEPCRTDMKSLAWTVSKNETELTPTFVEDPEWKTLLTCLSSHLHLTDFSDGELWPLESQSHGTVVDSYKIVVDRNESFFPWKEPQIFLSIHSPFVPVHPLLEGVLLKTGHSYFVHVRLEEEHLLPDPYQTNCTDYGGLWLKNNMSSLRSQEMCRDVCLWFTSPNSTLRMAPPEYDSPAYTEMYGRWNSSEECMENCSADCVKLKYSYSVFERISGAVDLHLPRENGEISVQILIAEPVVSVTTHVPVYDFGCLISRVGGLLAFWIGISVWALVGTLEMAVRKTVEWMR